MPELILPAVSTGFMTVRLLKGGWLRHPHYLACAILGSILAALALHFISPDMDDDMVMGLLAGGAGGWLGMAAFDLAVGRAA